MLELLLKIIQHNLKLREKKIPCLTYPKLRSSSSPTLFMSDWANLPEDILDEIIKKMSYVDYSTFCAVCKSWGYIDRFFCSLPRNIPFGVPILLLNTCTSDSNLYKFAKMNGEIASDNIFMPEAVNKRVCGSSWGWLILEGIDSTEVNLLNPFTRRVIPLPSVDTFTCVPNVSVNGFNYIHKAILSTNPTISEQDCIIMAIVGQMGKLYYCKIGDKKWTNIDGRFSKFCDVIYYNGKFYAISKIGVLLFCDLMDPNFAKTIPWAPPIHPIYPSMKYLVTVSERLLLLYKTETNRFKFHLLNICSPSVDYHGRWQSKWVEINSIGDQLLFVGNNGSFSLPAQSHSSRAKCIYFTEKAFGWVRRNRGSNYFMEKAFGWVPWNHDYNRSFGMYDIAKNKFSIPPQDEVFRSSFWMIPSPW